MIISKTYCRLCAARGLLYRHQQAERKIRIPQLGAYSASKHALHGFFETLRAEYENDGIRVTMITAGLVKTNITLNALKGNGMGMEKCNPLQQVSLPESAPKR